MTVKFGIKSLSMAAALGFATVIVAGCTEEAPPPTPTPAPVVTPAPAPKDAMETKPMPPPATPEKPK